MISDFLSNDLHYMEWILNCYFNDHYYIIIVHVVDLVITNEALII